MKLRDILNTNKDSDVVTIEYRTYYEDHDILAGYAEFSKGHLRSLDHDTYSLNDVFNKWEFSSTEYPNDYLTVWY